MHVHVIPNVFVFMRPAARPRLNTSNRFWEVIYHMGTKYVRS